MAGNWKYVKPDPKGLEDNPFIHPVREARPWHASFIIAMNPPPVTAGRGLIPRARRVNWGRRNGLLFDENQLGIEERNYGHGAARMSTGGAAGRRRKVI